MDSDSLGLYFMLTNNPLLKGMGYLPINKLKFKASELVFYDNS